MSIPGVNANGSIVGIHYSRPMRLGNLRINGADLSNEIETFDANLNMFIYNYSR